MPGELIYEGLEGNCYWDEEKLAFWLDRPLPNGERNQGYFYPQYLPPFCQTKFVQAMLDFWAARTNKDELIIGGVELDPYL